MNKMKSRTPSISELTRRKAKWGYFFIAPWVLVFCVFYLFPLIYGIAVSFTDYNLKGMNFVGIQNYVKIFDDYAFWRSLFGTLRYAIISLPVQIGITLWIANTLRTCSQRVNTIVKLLIYLPGVVCSVAMVVVWNFLFMPNSGLVNRFLELFGVTNISIFDNASISIPVIAVLVALTNLGQNTVIFCGAINAIPVEYYEAAELDGANRRKQFFNITLPLLHQTLVYVLITNSIGALQIFVVPMLLTGGGPNYASSTLLMMIYNNAFTLQRFGYASALGVILFVAAGIIAIIQFKVTHQDAVEY